MTKSQLSPAPNNGPKLKKQRKCNQHLIKINFGAKNFFWKKFFFEKILSPTFHHHPGLALKNTSRVVIPTENGQTVQFQVLKHLFLSSGPWKTTKKTCISILRQIWKKPTKRGVFSPKRPQGTRPGVLPGSEITIQC